MPNLRVAQRALWGNPESQSLQLLEETGDPHVTRRWPFGRVTEGLPNPPGTRTNGSSMSTLSFYHQLTTTTGCRSSGRKDFFRHCAAILLHFFNHHQIAGKAVDLWEQHPLTIRRNRHCADPIRRRLLERENRANLLGSRVV
jgi:hypothetical protein